MAHPHCYSNKENIYGLQEGKMTPHIHNDYHTTRNIWKNGLCLSQHRHFFHQTISSSCNWCITRFCFWNALQICLSPCEVLECLCTYGTMESGMLGGWCDRSLNRFYNCADRIHLGSPLLTMYYPVEVWETTANVYIFTHQQFDHCSLKQSVQPELTNAMILVVK